jgi:very-short-patch-repair endonuclease
MHRPVFPSPCKGEEALRQQRREGVLMPRFTRTQERTARAQQLRKDATRPERILWSRLRSAQMGVSFRRQHPVGPYILDFYCAPKRLAVELDGDQHGTTEGLAHDAARTRFLNAKAIRVLRFTNSDVRENLDGVCEGIYRALQSTPSHARALRARDLPLSGGGEPAESPPPERGRKARASGPGRGSSMTASPMNFPSKEEHPCPSSSTRPPK